MSPEPADKKLYSYVKRLADAKFASKTGIYKSSWIVQEYKRRKGTYIGRKPSSKSPGLRRWYREDWVDLNRPIRKNGKVVGYEPCGRTPSQSKQKYPLCRPTHRVSIKTPRTYSEIDQKSIVKAKRKKSVVKGTRNISFGGATKPNSKSIAKKSPKRDAAQYYGRRSSVNVPVPKSVKQEALYSFDLRKLGFRGGIETGWRRAHQLATKATIPIEDLKYMRNWFARHIYVSYPAYKQWVKAGKPLDDPAWYKRRGIIAWYIWGGDNAFKWVNSKRNVDLLNNHYDKDYKIVKLPK